MRAAKNWKRNSYCYFLPRTLHVIYFWFMLFNATINNISVIWWRSVLLEEQTRVLGDKSLTNFITMLYRVHLAMNGVRIHNLSRTN